MILKELKIDTSGYEAVYTLNKGELFYALSKDVSDDMVQSMQKALDGVKSSGGYEKIMASYR
ncbi:hypothetical protein [Dongshaea marina]|uniref:hypothetical protein n=1 Tax=Dongshaea marina TaxID=2047966 RepID=UPI000D3E44A2|nr:hypothetical protein [Dongshaea marina]